jgi:hypothetical protein
MLHRLYLLLFIFCLTTVSCMVRAATEEERKHEMHMHNRYSQTIQLLSDLSTKGLSAPDIERLGSAYLSQLPFDSTSEMAFVQYIRLHQSLRDDAGNWPKDIRRDWEKRQVAFLEQIRDCKQGEIDEEHKISVGLMQLEILYYHFLPDFVKAHLAYFVAQLEQAIETQDTLPLSLSFVFSRTRHSLVSQSSSPQWSDLPLPDVQTNMLGIPRIDILALPDAKQKLLMVSGSPCCSNIDFRVYWKEKKQPLKAIPFPQAMSALFPVQHSDSKQMQNEYTLNVSDSIDDAIYYPLYHPLYFLWDPRLQILSLNAWKGPIYLLFNSKDLTWKLLSNM